MTVEEARAAYPVLERHAYLNAGTFGPLARLTADAIAAERQRDLERGRSGADYIRHLLDSRERVRAAIAEEIGVGAEKVALTRATTDSCNLVLAGLGLGPEDEVVTTDGEHFGLLGALRCSEARIRVARIRGRPADAALDVILAEITPKTRLIGLSHVSWLTGHRLPIHELKEETRLPMLVDGAQSVGAIPVDASRFDFYTVSCQKWLCGPDAVGALYVADPDALRVTFPSYFSQASYDPDTGEFAPRPGAARFDVGWLDPGVLAGTEAALGVHPDWRFERASAMAARCRELLEGRCDLVTEPGHGTLVSLRPAGDAAEAAARAHEQGVVLRDLPATGWLRVSCGYWTSEEDLDRLLAVLTG